MKIKFFFLFLLASVSSVVYALPVSPEEPPNPLDLLPALGSVVEGATGEALAPSVPGGDLPDPQTSVEQQPTEHQPAEEPTMQQAEIDLTPEDEDWANREALRQAQLRNQFQRPPRSENDADLFKILEGFFKVCFLPLPFLLLSSKRVSSCCPK